MTNEKPEYEAELTHDTREYTGAVISENTRGIAVVLTTSDIDGKPVIFIDTSDATGDFRVYINDGCIWAADTQQHRHTECECTIERNYG